MTSLHDVVVRHFIPTLAMLREIVETCPDAVWDEPQIGVREHVYHVLVGADVWLSPDVASYPFDQIVDDDGAEFRAPASAAISRDYLLAYVDLITARVAALPESDAELLAVQLLRGREFTLLDRCLGQFRHMQHHIGVINEKLRVRGASAVDWQGYGEE